MGTSLIEFKAAVLDQLLSFLWRQWSALGVSGYGAAEEHRVIDPEPLLLLSLTVCRYDARLFDEILDWLMVNGAFLNVQRLKNIERQSDFQCKAQLSAVSELLGKNSNYALKWKSLSIAFFYERRQPSTGANRSLPGILLTRTFARSGPTPGEISGVFDTGYLNAPAAPESASRRELPL